MRVLSVAVVVVFGLVATGSGSPASPERAAGHCIPARTAIPLPRIGNVDLTSVAAAPDGSVWAVGGKDLGSARAYRARNVVLRWDGRAVKQVPVPGSDVAVGLRAVVSTGKGDAWAVGGEGGVVRWDGRRWSRVRAPSGRWEGIAALTRSDIWVVGETSQGFAVIRWNGNRWRELPSPSAAPSEPEEIPGAGSAVAFSYLLGVLPLAADDVWTVGQDGSQTFTAHWDGQSWTPYHVPDSQGGRLGALAALSPDHIWAAGNWGGGDLAEWRGARWINRSVQPRVVHTSGIAVRRGEVWALVDDRLSRWTGTRWVPLEARLSFANLTGLAIDTRGDAWVVGHTWGSLPTRPLMYRYRCR